MATNFTAGKFQAVGSTGLALSGALLYTYEAGGLTPLATYTNQGAGSENANPVVCDSAGQAGVWLGASAYRMILKTAEGVTVWDVDNITATATAADISFAWATLYATGSIGWAARTSATSYNFLRSVPVAEWAAILDGTSTYDVTTLLNTAISTYKDVYLPAGVYYVNPDTGVQFVHGMNLHGAGMSKSIINAASQGGTSAELVAYSKGSVLRRTFTPAPGTNAYIQNVRLADFGVIMNHPTASVTTTEIQIGIDMRNVTRSRIERVHVGNIVPLGCTLAKADPTSGYECQGYGIVFGNVTSGASSYCGGEVHVVSDCQIWGAYKGIVQDDLTLSPSSAAHAVRVINTDIQTAHHLLVQESQYATGCLWEGNVVQNAKKQNGDASSSYVFRMAGYANRLTGGYVEAGSAADYLLRLDSASVSNHVDLDHVTATNAAVQWSDVGTDNYVRMRRDTGTIVGGYDSKGVFIEYFNRARLDIWLKFHWSGAAIVVDGGDGATIARNGAGDYTITFTYAFLTDDYAISVVLDTDGAGTPGTFAIRSHGTTNLRLSTFTQNAGVTTAMDPAFVWVRVSLR